MKIINEILNFDKSTYIASQENLSSLFSHLNYNFNEGDIKSHRLISDSINEFCPDILVNFAAESHVDRFINVQKIFIDTNILGNKL